MFVCDSAQVDTTASFCLVGGVSFAAGDEGFAAFFIAGGLPSGELAMGCKGEGELVCFGD